MATKPTSSARRRARSASAQRADKSLDQFRNALEKSLTLSRERIEEVMDDAVKRGRMTRKDAEELANSLVERGRKQTEELVAEIESFTATVRERVESLISRSPATRKKSGPKPTASKSAAKPKTARKRPAKKAPGNPIANYDKLSAADVRKRLAKLSPAELRKVRSAEKAGKGRKTVLVDIEKRLG